jgi:hypothetical protein
MMKYLLDPKFGGKVRVAIQVLSAVVAVLLAFEDVPRVAMVLPILSAIISGLTHLTDIGNVN